MLGLVPRLAGTFELELHGAVAALIEARPRLVVNIGAADGYYAVGMALHLPDAEVIAYEADPNRSRICSSVIELNGAQDRVDLRGLCTPEALAQLNPPPGTAVVCDVDGAERELIDPARVGWLREATLLIEVHESLAAGVTATLEERLGASHSLEWIEPSRRYLADPAHRMLWRTGLSVIQQQMLMQEVLAGADPMAHGHATSGRWGLRPSPSPAAAPEPLAQVAGRAAGRAWGPGRSGR